MASELVLIVNDERPIAEAIAYVIDDLGHRSLITDNGLDALEIVREQNPALLITDTMMRPVSGAQLIAILRTAYGERCPPIVLLASAGAPQLRQAKADAILGIPWDLQQLEDLVERFLGTDV
jgi:CheY-like chemotaxis protein